MKTRSDSSDHKMSHSHHVHMHLTAPQLFKGKTHERALTLIEILITISIIGILIVLLVVMLRPNDDLRCKLEAERLAAYISGAANEAKMRSGAVRVNFNFDHQGSAQRQVTQLRVESTQVGWSDQGKSHEVGKPVKLIEVETHLNGVSKGEGQAFFLFRNSFTPGGVARLALKKVMYAVIVPGHGEPPKVVRGRGELPPLSKGTKGEFKMPLNFSDLDRSTVQNSNDSRSKKKSRSSNSGSMGSSRSRPPFGSSPSAPGSGSPPSAPEIDPNMSDPPPFDEDDPGDPISRR